MTHRNSTGATDEWYTPPAIFDALGLTFDLDPCSSGHDHVPARWSYRKEDDGLHRPWRGLVWMNPPFGGRNGQVPWLRKFFAHGNGIALVMARTSAGWFHDWAPLADTMLFPRGKTKFLRPDGSTGNAPHDGVVLFGCGEVANRALRACGLGICVDVPPLHRDRPSPGRGADRAPTVATPRAGGSLTSGAPNSLDVSARSLPGPDAKLAAGGL